MFGFSLEPYSPLLYIQLTPYIENMLKRFTVWAEAVVRWPCS